MRDNVARDDQTGHATSEAGASTTPHHRTRTVIQQVENNAQHAPFPLNVVLEVSAEVVRKRLDRGPVPEHPAAA